MSTYNSSTPDPERSARITLQAYLDTACTGWLGPNRDAGGYAVTALSPTADVTHHWPGVQAANLSILNQGSE